VWEKLTKLSSLTMNEGPIRPALDYTRCLLRDVIRIAKRCSKRRALNIVNGKKTVKVVTAIVILSFC